MEVLVAIGVALGADLGVRYFPGSGPRIHDRFQAMMVEALIRSLDPRWRVRLEVPITKPARGVIDVVLDDATMPLLVATEVHSISTAGATARWGHEKAQALATLHEDAAGRGSDRVSEAASSSARRSEHGARAPVRGDPPGGVPKSIGGRLRCADDAGSAPARTRDRLDPSPRHAGQPDARPTAGSVPRTLTVARAWRLVRRLRRRRRQRAGHRPAA